MEFSQLISDENAAAIDDAFRRWALRCQEEKVPSAAVAWVLDEISAGIRRLRPKVNPKRSVVASDWARLVLVLDDPCIPVVDLPDRYLLALEMALLGSH